MAVSFDVNFSFVLLLSHMVASIWSYCGKIVKKRWEKLYKNCEKNCANNCGKIAEKNIGKCRKVLKMCTFSNEKWTRWNQPKSFMLPPRKRKNNNYHGSLLQKMPFRQEFLTCCWQLILFVMTQKGKEIRIAIFQNVIEIYIFKYPQIVLYF